MEKLRHYIVLMLKLSPDSKICGFAFNQHYINDNIDYC